MLKQPEALLTVSSAILLLVTTLLLVVAVASPWAVFDKPPHKVHVSGFELLGWFASIGLVLLLLVSCAMTWFAGVAWTALALPGIFFAFVTAYDVKEQIEDVNSFVRVEGSAGGIVTNIGEVARQSRPEIAATPIKTVHVGVGLKLTMMAAVIGFIAVLVAVFSLFRYFLYDRSAN